LVRLLQIIYPSLEFSYLILRWFAYHTILIFSRYSERLIIGIIRKLDIFVSGFQMACYHSISGWVFKWFD
jgi:hypothetical protein